MAGTATHARYLAPHQRVDTIKRDRLRQVDRKKRQAIRW